MKEILGSLRGVLADIDGPAIRLQGMYTSKSMLVLESEETTVPD
jgi:hypothetical protein